MLWSRYEPKVRALRRNRDSLLLRCFHIGKLGVTNEVRRESLSVLARNVLPRKSEWADVIVYVRSAEISRRVLKRPNTFSHATTVRHR